MATLAPARPVPVGRSATANRWTALRHDLLRFAAVGVGNTALFVLLYLMFRLVFPVVVANILATLLTALTGTGANGRLTFAVAGRIGWGAQLRGLVVTGLGLVVTTGAVATVDTGGSMLGESAVLAAAGVLAGLLRFFLLRHWVFGRR